VTYSQALLRTEMRALAALSGVALAVALGYALISLALPGGYPSPFTLAALTFQFAFVCGLIPVAIYGAPIYTWMQRRRILSWPRVMALGALPGAAAVPFGWTFGAIALASGMSVSCLTHCLARNDIAYAL
jgi:hypothetical protein